MKQSLQQFIQSEKERLARFEQFWVIGEETQPNDFPKEMNPGDWDEQFAIFELQP